MERWEALDRVRANMVRRVACHTVDPLREKLSADKWVLSSAMQKAIRRGDAPLGRPCALTLLQVDKAMLLRRLQVVVLEDVGLGDPGLIAEVFAATAYAAWRAELGADPALISYLVERLCEAPKDRTADLLIYVVLQHPDLEGERANLPSASQSELRAVTVDHAAALGTRAVAAWLASGMDSYDPRNPKRQRSGDLPALLATFADLGVPDVLIEACAVAAKRVRDPFSALTPLLWSVCSRSGGGSADPIDVSPPRLVHGVPTYALDGHTRLGKEAVRRFLHRSDPICRYLARHAARASWTACVESALFCVEGGEVSRQFTWSETERLTCLGIEADFHHLGVAPDAVSGLLELLREHLAELDDIRAGMLKKALRPPQLELFRGGAR